MDAFIVRCKPGQIKADGGDQAKFADGVRAIRKRWIQVWPSRVVAKLAMWNIGLEDTLDEEVPNLMGANDNHAEEHSVAEFIERVGRSQEGSS